MPGMSKGASLTRVNLTLTTSFPPPTPGFHAGSHWLPPPPCVPSHPCKQTGSPNTSLWVLFNRTDGERINTVPERSLVFLHLGVPLGSSYTALTASQQADAVTHCSIKLPLRPIILGELEGYVGTRSGCSHLLIVAFRSPNYYLSIRCSLIQCYYVIQRYGFSGKSCFC